MNITYASCISESITTQGKAEEQYLVAQELNRLYKQATGSKTDIFPHNNVAESVERTKPRMKSNPKPKVPTISSKSVFSESINREKQMKTSKSNVIVLNYGQESSKETSAETSTKSGSSKNIAPTNSVNTQMEDQGYDLFSVMADLERKHNIYDHPLQIRKQHTKSKSKPLASVSGYMPDLLNRDIQMRNPKSSTVLSYASPMQESTKEVQNTIAQSRPVNMSIGVIAEPSRSYPSDEIHKTSTVTDGISKLNILNFPIKGPSDTSSVICRNLGIKDVEAWEVDDVMKKLKELQDLQQLRSPPRPPSSTNSSPTCKTNSFGNLGVPNQNRFRRSSSDSENCINIGYQNVFQHHLLEPSFNKDCLHPSSHHRLTTDHVPKRNTSQIIRKTNVPELNVAGDYPHPY